MDVDAGARVGVLRHHARQELATLVQKAIGSAIDGDSIEPRIAGNDFIGAGGSRISFEGDIDILS